jgi:predicted MPP superfamily phosphohydrolase
VRASTLPIAAAVAGAAGLGWSLAEARAFTLRRFTLPVLPPGSEPLRILHVSDLHAVPSQRAKLEWLCRLGDLEPDLVVSTGDTLAHVDAVPAVLDAHGPLLERPGVFVLGSNDYFAPRPKNPMRYLLPRGGARRIHGRRLPTHLLVEGFRSAGWLDLTNRRGELKVNGLRLEFIGVDDPHLRRDRYADVAGPADPEAALTIGVTHAPYRRVLDAMAGDGAGLVLAGHTHGGQLCVPLLGALVTNCDLDRGRAKGVSRWPAPDIAFGGGRVTTRGGSSSDAWLHVSAGLGTSPFTPVRFACRPEASLLTLAPGNRFGARGRPRLS